jgi:predicted helicase
LPSTIQTVLAELIESATDERAKGDKFERLVKAYLSADPEYASRFDAVWLWMEWPDRQGKPDTGIDLVARERETGELTAIQCKFYGPEHTLQKADIDSFFTASGKEPFRSRLIVSTTDRWSKHAEDALKHQQIPVTRLRLQDLDESVVDWSHFSLSQPEDLVLKERRQLWPHQLEALWDVREGLKQRDRGKLIMACGTGKTFTSLRIVEDLVRPGGRVLYLVPSISLLQQTLREWTSQAEVPLRCFAVCSDTTVGKGNEDISPVDLAYPSTTNAAKLNQRLVRSAPDHITVVFSTYQSLPVLSEAQTLGSPQFDLVVCDEAHRTTGVTLVGEDESNFKRIHDDHYIKAAKRIYMTATPRIYDANSKSQAAQASAPLASMDDESIYGPELHRLGFGEAVERGLLSDYKVLVLAVDEQAVSQTFQSQLADENSELKLDDAAKIVGCWNGLAKRGILEHDFGTDTSPMRRAVAFSRSIRDSEKFTNLFTDIIDQYVEVSDLEDDASVLRCEAQHVDGTFNVLRRSERLDWLKASTDPNTCRILSNARCLAEGVDVPALDAVLFLNPRNSQVDVVQSVGRVMRLSPGKQYGYVILPIGIPSGMTPEQALADNQKYKVVWQVLQALRAHDERFNAMVNKIELNRSKSSQIQVIGVGGFGNEEADLGTATHVQTAFNFPQLADWREAIYAKIVQKVGDRQYWENWASDVQHIAENHVTRIHGLLEDPNLPVQATFTKFLEGLRANLNESITKDDAIDMLAQHLITRPVFDALFDDYSFTESNPVSIEMQRMLDALDEHRLETENETLESFYASVRMRAEGIDNAEGKQRIITELYEKFFKLAFPRVAASLGIVYTPVEVVDFILRSVEHILQTEFGASISDEGVHVLDPFTGTGTFIVRLLQSGLIKPQDLLRKYTSELHANEILLLAYYIAAINIEATYHGITGRPYEPFTGIVLTDTFQMSEANDSPDEVIFPRNNERVVAQKALDIRVILGNPPYSVGQSGADDNNANLKYPALDGSISRTYAARSSASLKISLYDSYIRAIRWASDRMATSPTGGVIAFVTNGGYIDSNTADGLRKTLADEFQQIYVYNLRGNQRTAGEQSRREGGKIFGSGSRATIAILLLVKKPADPTPATINYHDIGDYLTRDEKLAGVSEARLESLPWTRIAPNAEGDWINQRDDTFASFMPIGDKPASGTRRQEAVFVTYSAGLKTNRDAWIYNYCSRELEDNLHRLIEYYNEQRVSIRGLRKARPTVRDEEILKESLGRDRTRISWDGTAEASVLRDRGIPFDDDSLRVGVYRPFQKQAVYFNRHLNNSVYRLPQVFPAPELDNYGIYTTGVGSDKPFSALCTDAIPDLALWGSSNGQYFPRYTYQEVDSDAQLFVEGTDARYTRIDNISDAVLRDYRARYGETSKDDVFDYVYGLLHSPDYRQRYASDLKKMLPRIPTVASATDFRAFVEAGRMLRELHVGYESVEPFSLDEVVRADFDGRDIYRVQKMRYGKTGRNEDRSTIVYNAYITLSGIPDIAHEYMLGARSAVDWILERYQVKTDKDSGIVNDANDWCDEMGDPRYIIDLVKRIVTVSIKTVEIVRTLPILKVGD